MASAEKSEQAELKTRSDLSMRKPSVETFLCGSDGRERKSQAQARFLKIRKAVFNDEGKTQFSFEAEPLKRRVVLSPIQNLLFAT